MKKVFKIFFILFMFFALHISNCAQAGTLQNFNYLNNTTITSKEDTFQIYEARKENAVLSVNSSKKLQALNKKTPHNPFLLSRNDLALKKGSIFYYNSGLSQFPPAFYSVKTNDIRAP